MTSRRTYFQRALAITEPAVQPAETLLTENAGQKGLDFERRVSELSAEVSALKVHILLFDALTTSSSRDDREQLAMESLQLKQQQIRDEMAASQERETAMASMNKNLKIELMQVLCLVFSITVPGSKSHTTDYSGTTCQQCLAE